MAFSNLLLRIFQLFNFRVQITDLVHDLHVKFQMNFFLQARRCYRPGIPRKRILLHRMNVRIHIYSLHKCAVIKVILNLGYSQAKVMCCSISMG